MKTSKLIFACVCLIGLSQIVWSQNNASSHRHGIRGYLDPETGTFTTKAEGAKTGGAQLPLAGTPILFRETFIFSISASDIPAGAVIFCSANINTSDTNGSFYEGNTTVATRSGNSATCSVPILAKWTLVNPTTDTIDARYEAYAEQAVPVGSTTETIERYGEGPDLTLPVPANTQSVNNNVAVTM